MGYKKVTGVYGIVNLLDGKVYVGSAAVSLGGRWASHMSQLRKGIHGNRHLQRAWNRDGEDAFEFRELERCLPKRCIANEQGWIDRLNSADDAFGYNLSPTAGSPLGIQWPEEAKAKKSEYCKEKYQDPVHKAKLLEMNANAMKVLKGKVRPPAEIESIRQGTAAAMARPAVRANLLAGHAKRAANPLLRLKIKQGHKMASLTGKGLARMIRKQLEQGKR